MGAEKLYMMFYVIYLSLCLGAFLKFKNRGVKGWRLFFSLLTPAIGVFIALFAPIRFLKEKEECIFLRKIMLFPFLVYLTIKVFPIIVGYIANGLKEAYEKSRARDQKPSFFNFGGVLWVEVEKCYIEATGIRFGI